MARLESTARAGYFPTPPRVAAAIARHLARPPGGGRVVRLLDPCAGCGEAAAALAAATGAESFGIELNEERAATATGQLDHVLAGSAFAVRLSNGAFSCLYLNPPYDQDEAKGRLEHAFLTGLARALCPGGLLVFVVPQVRLAVSARYLAAHFERHAVFRFPDPEFAAFRQCVLFATRRPRAVPGADAQARIAACSQSPLPPLPDAPDGPPSFAVPALPRGDVTFAPLFFDSARAATDAQRRGVWAQPRFAEQVWPPDERPVRPLMPLRRGHLALLIAAGMLNNVALEQDGRRVLVKGRTTKEMVPVDTGDDDLEVEREVLRTSVVVLDLGSGAIEVVESGQPTGESAA